MSFHGACHGQKLLLSLPGPPARTQSLQTRRLPSPSSYIGQSEIARVKSVEQKATRDEKSTRHDGNDEHDVVMLWSQERLVDGVRYFELRARCLGLCKSHDNDSNIIVSVVCRICTSHSMGLLDGISFRKYDLYRS